MWRFIRGYSYNWVHWLTWSFIKSKSTNCRRKIIKKERQCWAKYLGKAIAVSDETMKATGEGKNGRPKERKTFARESCGQNTSGDARNGISFFLSSKKQTETSLARFERRFLILAKKKVHGIRRNLVPVQFYIADVLRVTRWAALTTDSDPSYIYHVNRPFARQQGEEEKGEFSGNSFSFLLFRQIQQQQILLRFGQRANSSETGRPGKESGGNTALTDITKTNYILCVVLACTAVGATKNARIVCSQSQKWEVLRTRTSGKQRVGPPVEVRCCCCHCYIYRIHMGYFYYCKRRKKVGQKNCCGAAGYFFQNRWGWELVKTCMLILARSSESLVTTAEYNESTESVM
jgi:hypothetical protein